MNHILIIKDERSVELLDLMYFDSSMRCSSIQAIIDDKSPIQDGEEKLAALTAGDRTPWAKARQEYFCKGVNKVSLSVIENAVFVVALDDSDYNYDPVRTH